MDLYLFKIFFAGCCFAIISGIVGNFVVWRRMAYFGDSLAHSSLLGIIIGFVLGIDFSLSVLLGCILFSTLILLLQKQKYLATDTILGILAHSSLGIGLVSLHFMNRPNFDLHSVLFGDILTITDLDVLLIFIALICVLVFFYQYWHQLLLITINEELAKAEGIKVGRYQISFVLLLSVIVAISIQIIGILLITSLLIIPAASSRIIATSPKSMVFYSVIFSVISVLSGIYISFEFDMTVSPTIVVISFLVFLIFSLLKLNFHGAKRG